MLPSFRNVHIYQCLVAKCLSDNKGLHLTNRKYENNTEIMAKRRAAIIKRNAELQERMNQLIRKSQDLLQKEY
jgi:hypothetical protein